MLHVCNYYRTISFSKEKVYYTSSQIKLTSLAFGVSKKFSQLFCKTENYFFFHFFLLKMLRTASRNVWFHEYVRGRQIRLLNYIIKKIIIILCARPQGKLILYSLFNFQDIHPDLEILVHSQNSKNKNYTSPTMSFQRSENLENPTSYPL